MGRMVKKRRDPNPIRNGRLEKLHNWFEKKSSYMLLTMQFNLKGEDTEVLKLFQTTIFNRIRISSIPRHVLVELFFSCIEKVKHIDRIT